MKNSSQLPRLLRQEESEVLEFKENFGKEALETICAFANTRGGILLIGVNDHGHVRGVQLGKSSLKDWTNEISQGTGGLHPSIEVKKIKAKSVVCIHIRPSRYQPVMFQGKAYKRIGNTTRQMGVEELTRMALTSHGVSWDELPETRAGISDIALPKVRAFIELAKQKRRRPVPSGTQPLELLQKLGLIREGKPTRAAVLLFGKNPQRFYLQALVKAGRFRGETLIIDDREIDGTLFDQVEGAMGYFREKLDTRFVMTGMPQREVIWEYPLDALREAVTNSVCHRDYLSSAHTQVRIYDNELMVWNPGGLPQGLSIEALKRKHESLPRNKLIAQVFYYAGLIEKWGGGTEKMIDDCAAAKLPEPVFEEVQGFRVTFKKTPDKHRTSTGQVAYKQGTSSVQAPDKHPTSTPQVPRKYPASTPQAPRKYKLVGFCARPRTIKEMRDFMKLRDREHFRLNHLQPLLNDGLLAMTNPDAPHSPKQKYIATPKGLALLKRYPPPHDSPMIPPP